MVTSTKVCNAPLKIKKTSLFNNVYFCSTNNSNDSDKVIRLCRYFFFSFLLLDVMHGGRISFQTAHACTGSVRKGSARLFNSVSNTKTCFHNCNQERLLSVCVCVCVCVCLECQCLHAFAISALHLCTYVWHKIKSSVEKLHRYLICPPLGSY